MGSFGRSINTIFGAIACFLCIGLLMSLAVENSSSGTKASTALSFQSTDPKVKLNPLYANKRRVPNGPDPIHNRREGKSGRPAGST